MKTTTTLAKLAAVTAAVAAPVMLFLGSGSATAAGHPGGGPDDPENSPSSVAVRSGILGSVPVAPAARPGSARIAPAVSTPKRGPYPAPQIKPGFEPETF